MSDNKQDKKCPSDNTGTKVQVALVKFMENPSKYKDDVRKICEKILTDKNISENDLTPLKNLIENCEDYLNSNDDYKKTEVLTMIVSLYLQSENVFNNVEDKDKYVPCIQQTITTILATPKMLEQITCDFFPKKPFFETPLGIAVIVGGSVILLAIIILIVMNTSGGKRRRRK